MVSKAPAKGRKKMIGKLTGIDWHCKQSVGQK